MPAILIWSAALLRKAEKVEQKASFPLQAMPLATPTMFCSAMKHSTKLSGYLSPMVHEKVLTFVSPSRATTLLSASLALRSPFP